MAGDSVKTFITYDTFNSIRLGAITFDKTQLLSLEIKQKFNDHAKISFTGYIKDELDREGELTIGHIMQANKYITHIDSSTEIEVTINIPPTVLFRGTVTKVDVNYDIANHYYLLSVEGLNYTYLMDIALHDRAFQKTDMTYEELIKIETKIYNAECKIAEELRLSTEKVDHFTLQCRETDWQFLKRIASQFQTGLIANPASESVKFWFGIEGNERGNIDLYKLFYSTGKHLVDYLDLKQNHLIDVQEDDFQYYQIRTNQLFTIGDKVNIKIQEQTIPVYVYQSTLSLVNRHDSSIMTMEYILMPTIYQWTLYNSQITGLSLEGTVTAVGAEENSQEDKGKDKKIIRDQIKVSFPIDAEGWKPEETCWFPFATPYVAGGYTGWYCMPEIGDKVKVSFPDNLEQNAVVTYSVRTKDAGERTKNPNVKYFRTKSRKEIMFAEKEIRITAYDTTQQEEDKAKAWISLNEDKGIEIWTEKEVKIVAQSDLTINSEENIEVSAQGTISLIGGVKETKDKNGVKTEPISSIVMNQNETKIKSPVISSN